MPRRRWDDPWQRYSESRPIPVDDGIATTRTRGAMAEQWWSKRFVEVLDTYGLGTRMQRGKRYARSGQLLSFEVQPGELLAEVQGSRRTPYRVTVHAPVTSDAQWAEVDVALSSRVKFAARLLAGEVPGELEEVFASAGVVLLPKRWSDVAARCTCPDSANPCKHIAATLYVFADKLDSDPWLLLEWRGRTREQILGPLLHRTTTSPADDAPDEVTGLDAGVAVASDVAPWWPLDPRRARSPVGDRASGTVAGRLLDVDRPDPPEIILQRLDDLTIEVQAVPVTELLPEAYRVVTTDLEG
jgi:uncharacterized Zn finger protein